MSNPYDADVLDGAGNVRISGAVDFTDPDNQPGGGATPVSCLLACDTDFDIKTVALHPVLWDALYDNFWDLNPLAAIPDGLGLDFAFDGTASAVTPSEAGVWAFSYFGVRVIDTALVCVLRTGFGPRLPWVQDRATNGDPLGYPNLAASVTAAFPVDTDITHDVETIEAGAGATSDVTQVYLSIVRLG